MQTIAPRRNPKRKRMSESSQVGKPMPKVTVARNVQNLLKLSNRKVSLRISVAEITVEAQLVGISSDREDCITQRAGQMHQANLETTPRHSLPPLQNPVHSIHLSHFQMF